MIAIDELRKILSYDPLTGVFHWKERLSIRAPIGSVAGASNGNGYIRIRMFGKNYYAHRLAWFYVHEKWPTDQIDHINGDRSDNHIANLRKASQTQQNGNTRLARHNTSGVKGVHWSNKEKRWIVQIHQNNYPKRIGAFHDIETARAAYAQAALSYFGEFARTA